MKHRYFSLAALFALGTLASTPVDAQVSAGPQTMNFQGRLAAPSGNPVPNGTYSIRFSLWNVASGGTAAANEKYNKTLAAVQVKNGTFAVTLDAFPATLFNGNLWLEIKVGSDAALTPRQQLVTVPYAFKADKVKDGAIVTASLANGAITDAKIVSVAWSKLTGVPVDSLTLPFYASQSTINTDILFHIYTMGNGISIFGDATDGVGVYGRAVNNAGIQGESTSYAGVSGVGRSGGQFPSHGVRGFTYATDGGGVVGIHYSNSTGVLGGNDYGVYGSTPGTNGVYGISTGGNGNGVYGVCNNGSLAYGVYGSSTSGYGVVGSGVNAGIYSFGPSGGTGPWVQFSDVRYKQNIATFDNALDAILNLRGVTFAYRCDEFKDMNFVKGTQIGFIAQEVEKILPELVTTDANGYKSVSYSNAVPVLVEAVKTLNAHAVLQQKQHAGETAALKAENAELRAKLDAILKRIDALEAASAHK